MIRLKDLRLVGSRDEMAVSLRERLLSTPSMHTAIMWLVRTDVVTVVNSLWSNCKDVLKEEMEQGNMERLTRDDNEGDAIRKNDKGSRGGFKLQTLL